MPDSERALPPYYRNAKNVGPMPDTKRRGPPYPRNTTYVRPVPKVTSLSPTHLRNTNHKIRVMPNAVSMDPTLTTDTIQSDLPMPWTILMSPLLRRKGVINLFITVTILPAVPVFKLTKVTTDGVISSMVTRHNGRLFIIRYSIGTKILSRPINAVMGTTLRMTTATTLTGRINRTPSGTLCTIQTVISISTGNLRTSPSTNSTIMMLNMNPIVLRLKRLNEIYLMTDIPGKIRIITGLDGKTTTSYNTTCVPTVPEPGSYRAKMLTQIMMVKYLRGQTRIVTIIGLRMTGHIVSVTPTRSIVMILTALPATRMRRLKEGTS